MYVDSKNKLYAADKELDRIYKINLTDNNFEFSTNKILEELYKFERLIKIHLDVKDINKIDEIYYRKITGLNVTEAIKEMPENLFKLKHLADVCLLKVFSVNQGVLHEGVICSAGFP